MIINKHELMDDSVEKLAESIGVSLSEARAIITQDNIDWIAEEMLDKQSDCIKYLEYLLKEEK